MTPKVPYEPRVTLPVRLPPALVAELRGIAEAEDWDGADNIPPSRRFGAWLERELYALAAQRKRRAAR